MTNKNPKKYMELEQPTKLYLSSVVLDTSEAREEEEAMFLTGKKKICYFEERSVTHTI